MTTAYDPKSIIGLVTESGPLTPAEWELLSPPQRRQVVRADRDSRVEARKLFAGFASLNVSAELAAAGASEEAIAAAVLPFVTESQELNG